MYIEIAGGETFHQIVDSVSSTHPNIAMPQTGGAGEEKVKITTKEATTLMGISYKGDIGGWRARFVDFCKATRRKYGFIRESVISFGRRIAAA